MLNAISQLTHWLLVTLLVTVASINLDFNPLYYDQLKQQVSLSKSDSNLSSINTFESLVLKKLDLLISNTVLS